MDNKQKIEVILVNEQDIAIGTMEKLEAHQKGLLHRAFSVFVFNDKNELLLQKRALGKYHSEGLWTNTCCSHPSPEESSLTAAHRRLQEEMGFDCELKETFNFIYKVELENQLIEHELDHVIIGYSNDMPILNELEASAYKWMSLENIQKDMQKQPECYTFWFKIIINEHLEQLQKKLNNESLQKRNV